jgi:uncharacterized membrane protein
MSWRVPGAASTRAAEEERVGYICLGLCAIISGFMLGFDGDNGETAFKGAQVVGLVLLVAGALAVIIGMVTHVVAVTREDRSRRGSL